MPSHKPEERIAYLDNLRAALVILVVLHHIALVYGAAAPFYYVEPPFGDPLAGLALLVFVLFNQAWFMGALFLLSGIFTPRSLERQGTGTFVRTRLVRLGIPLVLWIFVLEPISRLGVFLMPESLTGLTGPPTWSINPKLLGLGPLWFVALLLLMDLAYAGWRSLTTVAPFVGDSAFPAPAFIAAFVILLAIASYLLRIAIPLGRELHLVLPFLNFPTIAYLPQYVAFFVVGIIAGRRGWLQDLPTLAGPVGFSAALLATILLFPLAVSGRWFSLAFAEPPAFIGGGTWESAVYAMWDSTMAVGLTLAALVFFHRFFNRDRPFGRLLSRNSYAVYIIHVPIVVYSAYLLRNMALAPLAKFTLAAVLLVPLCFVVAAAIRRTSLVARVV